MTRTLRFACMALVASGWIAVAQTSPTRADDRTADAVLKDLDANQLPQFNPSKSSDRDAMKAFFEERQKVAQKRAELILELYKVAPDHEKLVELLPERWLSASAVGPQREELLKEIDAVMARTKSEELKARGALTKVQLAYARLINEGTPGAHPDLAGLLPAIEDFIKLAPKDPRGPSLLATVYANTKDEKIRHAIEERILEKYADSPIAPQLLALKVRTAKDETERQAIEDRILKDYPDNPVAEQIKSARHQREAIGKPFDLEFKDVTSGETASIKGLKGKVVVVDFWATWCPPCVAAMPDMKALYKKYRDQGVEFLGISLDEEGDAGLTALKTFIKDKQIPWPQYYQGKGWESEFSRSWGISAIPAVFVVDQDGKLNSVEAHGEELEALITDLLKKNQPAAPAQ